MTQIVRLKQPLQQRSRETLDQLVTAAYVLLETRNWEDVSILDLVRESRSSVGSFYARFPTKDAFLDYLDELYAQDFIALVGAFVDNPVNQKAPLAGKIHALVRDLISFYSERKGIARALVLRARTLRESAFEERTKRMNRSLRKIYALLLAGKREIRHPAPERAVFFAFHLAFSTLRERVLFPETIQDTAGSRTFESELTAEVTRASVRYLGLSQESLSP